MYEYKCNVELRHKVTGETLKLTLWTNTRDEVNRKLSGLCGSNGEYTLIEAIPIRENDRVVGREVKDGHVVARPECATREELREIGQELLEFLRQKKLPIWQVKEILRRAGTLVDWEPLK